jgi:hypothetical protein
MITTVQPKNSSSILFFFCFIKLNNKVEYSLIMSPSLGDNVAQVSYDAAQNVLATTSSITDKMRAITPSTDSVMLVVVVLSILVSLYVGYYLYKLFIKTSLETVTFIKSPVKVSQTTVKLVNMDEQLPPLRNGTEYAYSFWMYLNSFQKNSAPQMILFGGLSKDSPDTPIFYLDSDYVKFNASVKTNSSDSGCTDAVLSVDYIPRQRWVNVCLVVDNEFVQLFIDGELRKVLDTSEKTTMSVDGSMIECQNRLVKTNAPNIYAGNVSGFSVIDGFLSKVQFFNYVLTMDHVKMIYNAGPMHQNILTRIGVPLYGVRNPFYKIDEVTSDDDNVVSSNT